MQMVTPTLYEQFAENLYRESPRGWAELESMKYGIMARTGLPEGDALEIVCRIVATEKPITTGEPHKEKVICCN